MSEQSVQASVEKKRVSLYVDGWNMYYPIHESGKPYLKWICLWKLAEILSEPHNGRVVKSTFCTAVPTEANSGRWLRHNSYNNALIANGVTILKGHHVTEKDGTRAEKQSDLNLGLSLICDAHDNIFDIAFIISADSDQTATAKFLKQRCPDKGLYIAAPWGKHPPRSSRPYVNGAFSLTEEVLERAVMPSSVSGKAGLIIRPVEYNPPVGWVHPENRPRRKDTQKKNQA